MTPGPEKELLDVNTTPDGEEDGSQVDETESEAPECKTLENGILQLTYVPDFRVDDLFLYFVPDLPNAREVYHALPEALLERWGAYLTKKGYRFLASDHTGSADGPYRVKPGGWRIEIPETKSFFLPKPMFRFSDGGEEKTLPLVSLEKRRPIDPWKPNYIRATAFIKKYSPVRPLSKAAEYALWEIEECGEIAGSTAWHNAELVLGQEACENADLRAVLADVFHKRPEDFALGSEVYLRVLGRSGDEGFQTVCDFHSHPQRIKRCHVARAVGRLGRAEGLNVLLDLLEDEDPEVREVSLQAIGRAGISRDHPEISRIKALLKSENLAERILATVALMRGGDPSQEKKLIQFLKEHSLPLIDMGDLGRVIVELELFQCTPFLISRLKSDRVEIRDDAAEVLRELTGLQLEFHGHSTTEERRKAVREWTRWWDNFKRTRKSRSK